MGYVGDSVKDFGDYMKKEYSQTNTPLQIAKLAQRNFGVKPAGLQGYEGVTPLQVAKLAQRNAGVNPAGLQGFGEASISPLQITQLAQKNMGVKPAGLQGYGDFTPLDVAKLAQRNAGVFPAGLQGFAEDPNMSSISHMAVRNRNSIPAGGSLGFLGDEPANISQISHLAVGNRSAVPAGGAASDPALNGLGDEDANISQISHLAVNNFKSSPAGSSLGETERSAFEGLGEIDNQGNWDSFLAQASNATTVTALISSLQQAVASVPDNTDSQTKTGYYKAALDLIKQRKSKDLFYLDVKRVELESNIGWLVDPRVPKSGGFDKAIGLALGKVGAQMAKTTPEFQKEQGLLSFGKQLKNTLRKTGGLHGLTDLPSYVWFGLGVAAGTGLWYFLKSRKRK